MRKGILFLLILFVAVLAANAQDIINTKEAERLEVKIYEITDYSVKYKPMDDLGGPMLKMDAYKIASVEFENGIVYTFKDDIRPPEEQYEQNNEYANSSADKKKRRNSGDDETEQYEYSNQYSNNDFYNDSNYESYPLTLNTGKSIMLRPGMQLYKSQGKYNYGSYELTNKDFSSFILQTCPEANEELRMGEKMKYIGIGAIAGGVVLAGAGTVVGGVVNIIMGAVALGSIATGVVFLVKGKKYNDYAVDLFNGQCSNNVSASLSLYVSPVGVGMSLDF